MVTVAPDPEVVVDVLAIEPDPGFIKVAIGVHVPPEASYFGESGMMMPSASRMAPATPASRIRAAVASSADGTFQNDSEKRMRFAPQC
jgi:hypothetical protein